MRRAIQYGRCRFQLKRRLGVATAFRGQEHPATASLVARIFIDDLGGVFRLSLEQALYESVLVPLVGAVIPSDWSFLFHGAENPG